VYNVVRVHVLPEIKFVVTVRVRCRATTLYSTRTVCILSISMSVVISCYLKNNLGIGVQQYTGVHRATCTCTVEKKIDYTYYLFLHVRVCTAHVQRCTRALHVYCVYCTCTTVYTRVTRVLCVLYVYNGVRCTTTISERVAIQDTHYCMCTCTRTVHVGLRVDSFEGTTR
jgi:hypothetical protein